MHAVTWRGMVRDRVRLSVGQQCRGFGSICAIPSRDSISMYQTGPNDSAYRIVKYPGADRAAIPFRDFGRAAPIIARIGS